MHGRWHVGVLYVYVPIKRRYTDDFFLFVVYSI